jgi:hypothetical protein
MPAASISPAAVRTRRDRPVFPRKRGAGERLGIVTLSPNASA